MVMLWWVHWDVVDWRVVEETMVWWMWNSTDVVDCFSDFVVVGDVEFPDLPELLPDVPSLLL